MSRTVRRGYAPEDEKEFGESALKILSSAAADLFFLLNRGYPAKSASTFVGNHYLLSERQRLALARIVSTENDIRLRQGKELKSIAPGSEVNIDGFNTIITLEVALSGSPILRCMDGALRDLAGLRGTYRVIDKTKTAISLVLKEISSLGAGKANFFIDSPVSNSGRLKALIAEMAEKTKFKVNIEVTAGVDRMLQTLPHVISSDAIILDKCESWINLNAMILGKIGGIWEIAIWDGLYPP